LHLPTGEAPAAREGLSPKLPLASLDEPTRGRTADATSLPGLAALAPLGGERTGRPISGIGGLDEPTSKKLPASGLALPSPEVGTARPVTTNTRLELPTLVAADPGHDPAERLRIAIGEVAPTPVASGPGPSGSAGKPPERADRPLATSRALPPFDPANGATTSGERALRATAPESKPTVATVPVPFRLSAWVSDEETHRRWREQQVDRAGAEALRGARLFVSRSSFPTAGQDEFYWVDLIGLTVRNREGLDLGTVSELMSTGPQTVLVLTQANPDDPAKPLERMIPFVSAYVDKVDMTARLILVDWQTDY
jgi:hypothetical protein